MTAGAPKDRSGQLIALGLLIGAMAGGASWLGGLSAPACWTAAITGLCAAWWVTEALPIPATSIVPFALFPVVGVLNHKQVSQAYGHTLILLLLGGFILSTAMERSGAHRRLAIGMIRAVGGRGRKQIVLGFMIATAASSMWISNTATTLMLLPVALAVIDQDDGGALSRPLLLGIAYAASIGGIGTPVGTPPNVIFMSIYEETTGRAIDFSTWMSFGVPVVVVLIPLTWIYLTRGLLAGRAFELPTLGPWRVPEKRVMIIFGLTALAWVTRAKPFGGWTGLIGATGVGDSTVALLAVATLFVVPDGAGRRMLDWETAEKIPWGLLILFGGGLAIAEAFKASGLSTALGGALSALSAWPALTMTLTICLAVTFLTEVTSNTATTSLLMPILAAAGVAAALDPKVLMIPAAMSASCAFMLPVATAPNAIMFGTGRITLPEMARAGFALNLLGAVVITAICTTLL